MTCETKASLALLLLALAASCPAPSAFAVEIMDTLPGVDALDVGWNAQGPWCFSGGDLRRLALDTGPGGLLLRQRIVPPVSAQEALVGDRLVALRQTHGLLRLLDLLSDEVVDLSQGVTATALDGPWLLAGAQTGLRRCRLDEAVPAWQTVSGAFPGPPDALSLLNEQTWVLATDTLRGLSLADPPPVFGRLPFVELPLALRPGGARLAACLGADGLRVVDVADPAVPSAGPVWQPGFPVLDAARWRDQLWILAAGDSGLALADLGDINAPQLLGRWRTVRRAERLALKGDSLLVAEGADGLSLHVLRVTDVGGRPELLARHNTRPCLLSVPVVDPEENRFWCLDRNQGFRRLDWPSWPEGSEPVESAGVALSLPVDGGDIANDPPWTVSPLLFAGCRYGAGLSYYAETEAGIVLRGIYPSDPVKLMVWGPDDLIAYITPDAFVAIKQANRNPWFLRHHGTIYLQAEPLCATWSDHFLLVGCADGRVFCVDASDPAAPTLETVLQLAGPVRSLSACPYGYPNEVAAAAGPLYLMNRPVGSIFQVADSLLAAGDFVACSHTGYGVAATRDPDQAMEFFYWDNTGLVLDTAVDLAAPPLALARCLSTGSCGHALLGLENGDLLLLGVVGEIPVDPGPVRPDALMLAAHPNPFNPVTQLAFTLATPVDAARLTVHNLRGAEVERRELGPLPAGKREIKVDARAWPSGIYLARLEAGELSAVAKLLLVR